MLQNNTYNLKYLNSFYVLLKLDMYVYHFMNYDKSITINYNLFIREINCSPFYFINKPLNLLINLIINLFNYDYYNLYG